LAGFDQIFWLAGVGLLQQLLLTKLPSLKHLSMAGNYFDGNIPV